MTFAGGSESEIEGKDISAEQVGSRKQVMQTWRWNDHIIYCRFPSSNVE